MSGLLASSPPTHTPSPASSTTNGVLSVTPSNSQIEAVIQMATSSASSSDSRISGRDTRTQLFVGNLPYRVRWQDLKDLFRKAGTVLRADVSLGLDNRSRGYGTVLLATSEDAARAVDMFNGYNWQTRTLEVRPDRLPPDFDNPNFMMTGNSGSLTTSSAGHPFPIPMHPIPYGNSLGDGVSIPGPDDFDISKLFGEQTRSASGAGTRNLFVGNLPFHCQWQDLKDLFRQAGTIVRADVALGPDGRSRGFGTVSFANDTDAERALNIFNGYEYNGRTLKVHYDKYSQGQPSQSPIPPSTLPSKSPQQLPPSHPNAPSHIPMPMPPPLAAFEQLMSGHQSPSPFDHPFGQISPYDVFPPHIAAIAGNAAAQAYMNNPQRSPPVSTHDHPPASGSGWAPLASAGTNRTPVSSERKESVAEESNPLTTTPPNPPSSAHPPAHPGPIALPSPPIHPFPQVPMSPLQGLPPITPSMPSFTFVPQNATPPLSAHFLSPGIGLTPFSPPGTMSPGAFYHPASGQRHALGHVWNVAPGTQLLHSPVGSPGSPGFYTVQPHQPPLGAEKRSPQANVGLGMGDYFSVPAPPASEGYFPPITAVRGSGLSNEITQEGESPSSTDVHSEHRTSDSSVPTISEVYSLSEFGSKMGDSSGTSLEDGESGRSAETKLQTQSSSGHKHLGTTPGDTECMSQTPVPHRTHSDGDGAVTLSTAFPSESSGSTKPTDGESRQRWKGRDLSVTSTSERRASWTSNATRDDFRRGL